MLKNYIF